MKRYKQIVQGSLIQTVIIEHSYRSLVTDVRSGKLQVMNSVAKTVVLLAFRRKERM